MLLQRNHRYPMSCTFRCTIRRALLPFVAIALAATSFCAAAANPITIKFAWYIPPGTAVDKQGHDIAAAIEKLSKGSIKVETYPGGSLLKETNMARGLQDNIVQMGILGVHWWANQEPSTSFDSIPFLVPDTRKLLDALHGPVGKDIQTILGRHDVAVVGWGFYGYTGDYINSKRAIQNPEDLKGLRMRADGPLPAAFMKKFGAIATTIDSSEVYTALQRGTLDGATSGMSTFVSRKWIEVGKYITAVKPMAAIYPTQVNLTWWKGLTPEQRDIITKAVASTEQDNIKTIEAEWKDDINIAEKRGIKVYQPEGSVLAHWKDDSKFMSGVYLKSSGADGKKILDDIKPYE